MFIMVDFIALTMVNSHKSSELHLAIDFEKLLEDCVMVSYGSGSQDGKCLIVVDQCETAVTSFGDDMTVL